MGEEVVVFELRDVRMAGSGIFGGFCGFVEGSGLEWIECHDCALVEPEVEAKVLILLFLQYLLPCLALLKLTFEVSCKLIDIKLTYHRGDRSRLGGS